MNRLYFLIGCVSLFSVSAQGDSTHSISPATDEPSVNQASQNSEFYIPASEIAQVKHNALAGDAKAAERLMEYFMLDKHDHAQGMYWLQIEAENGDPDAQLNLGKMLANRLLVRSSDVFEADKIRACFWWGKALQNPVTHDDAEHSGLGRDCSQPTH
jgi:hypothetical protein